MLESLSQLNLVRELPLKASDDFPVLGYFQVGVGFKLLPER